MDVRAEPTATDWAYAAGLVDGEGCIAITRHRSASQSERYVYQVGVIVVNRDREVLDWMRTLWAGWVVARLYRSAAYTRTAWAWGSPSGLAATPFLIGIRPWLRIKLRQCDNALAMAAVLQRSRYTLGRRRLPEAWLADQEQHYWIQRKLNHRGMRPFEAKPLYAPREVSRQRAIAAQIETLQGI